LTVSQIAKRFKIVIKVDPESSPLQVKKFTHNFAAGDHISRVALFSHWESTGIISNPDLYSISMLKQCGFRVIVITTAEMSLSEHDDVWFRHSNSIDGLISRTNLGFDFGSWQEGLAILAEEKIDFDELILMNNSLYPIAESISDLLKTLQNELDVGGLIWSNEFRKHIQSFFLYFNSKAIHSSEFLKFWNAASALKDPSNGKRSVITKFELTWADYFAGNEFLKVGAIFDAPPKSIRNPMTFYWRDLISQGFPFIKKSLFLQNYEKVEVSDWVEFVENYTSKERIDAIALDIENRKRR
jgi:lipopolysaccharide biosynthesis protein